MFFAGFSLLASFITYYVENNAAMGIYASNVCFYYNLLVTML